MKNLSPQCIILSAELESLNSSENLKRTNILEECIKDLNLKYSSCLGVYKGNKESSFIVLVSTLNEIKALSSIAFINFNQESVLHKDSQGLAHLMFNDNTEKYLGKLKSYTKLPNNIKDYTYFKGKYYAA